MRTLLIAWLVMMSTMAQAETFPALKFEDVRGKVVLLGQRAKKASVVVLSKPGRGNRKVNEAWIEALLPELKERSDLDLFMLADFAGLPGFLNKDKLRQKMLDKSEGTGRAVLETMLFDWHGEARPKLVEDSQIYVYIINAQGEVKDKVVGFVKPERVKRVVKATKQL